MAPPFRGNSALSFRFFSISLENVPTCTLGTGGKLCLGAGGASVRVRQDVR